MRDISLSLNIKAQLCKIEKKKTFLNPFKANPELPTTMTNDP